METQPPLRFAGVPATPVSGVASDTIEHQPFFRSDLFGLSIFPFVTALLTLFGVGVTSIGWVTRLDPDGRWQHRINQLWARLFVRLSPLGVRVTGLSRLADGGEFVIVLNHLSAYDNLLVLSELPLQFKFFGHRRFFRVLPAMHMARYIPVDRDKPHESRARLLRRGVELLRKGISVLVFAEGTRSRDGRLQEFKSGAFELAVAAGAAVLPVAIRNTFDVMPKGSFRVLAVDVSIEILAPIVPTGTGAEEIERLRLEAWRAIAQAVEGRP